MTTMLLALHGLIAAGLVVASILALRAHSGVAFRRVSGALLGLVVLQTFLGDLVYPRYLRAAKPALRALTAGGRSPADAFEVKEHLAFFVLATALGAYVLARGAERPGPVARVLVSAAHALIVIVACLGLVVASMRTP